MGFLQPFHQSFKGVYPFRLGVTSYVYPGDWVINADLLGPHVDEIELLMLESSYEDCYPSVGQIDELVSIAEKYALTFNVHLPADVSLGDLAVTRREAAIDTLCHVIGLTKILRPVTWTLHIPLSAGAVSTNDIANWRTCCRDGLKRLIDRSGISSESLSVETLFYPFEWIGDILEEMSVNVCIDTGHLMLMDKDPLDVYACYAEKVSILHIHGVQDQKDHLSLDRLSAEQGEKILSMLKRFRGTVSIEVFSVSQLIDSLAWLDRHWSCRNGQAQK